MNHALQFVAETATDTQFQCTRCSAFIDFNKEGVGTPCATLVAGSWVPAEKPEQWMGDCPEVIL